MAARLKEALQQAEEKKDPQPVVSLLREGARLTNLDGDEATGFRTFHDSAAFVRNETAGHR